MPVALPPAEVIAARGSQAGRGRLVSQPEWPASVWPRLSGTAWWQQQQAASDSSVACQRWPRAAARYVWPGPGPGVAARVCIGTYSSLQLSRSLRAGKLSQRLGLAGRLSLTGASHPYYILPLS